MNTDTWWILIGESICYWNVIQQKWYDLIIITQHTYKEVCTLILIDLKVYIIDTCDIIFKFQQNKNKCYGLNILNRTHIWHCVYKYKYS